MLTLMVIAICMGDLKGVPQHPYLMLHDETKKGELLFASAWDVQISEKGWVFVLDTKDGQVLKFDMEGQLLKRIGRSGMGPEELAKPVAMCLVGGDLWVADQTAGGVKIIRNDKISRVIRSQKISMPANVARVGQEVFVSGSSFHPEIGSIEVYASDGSYKRTITTAYFVNKRYGKTSSLWSTGVMFEGHENQLAIGFIYDSRFAVMDSTGRVLKDVLMTSFYDKYENKVEGALFPGGYAAKTFSAGPHGSYLIATCSLEQRSCEVLIQVTKNLKGLLGKREVGDKIKQLRYFPDLKLMAMINANNVVMIYDVE